MLDKAAGALLVLAFSANIGSLAPEHRLSVMVEGIAANLYTRQNWAMFSPSPPRDDGWWVIPATLRDGTEVDLASAVSPVDWERPESIRATYGSPRWRKFLGYLWYSPDREKVRHYGDWLRYDWNRRHGPSEQIDSLTIYFMLELTMPDYNPPWLGKAMLYESAGEGTGFVVPYPESIINILCPVGGA